MPLTHAIRVRFSYPLQSFFVKCLNALLAQLVEQLTLNQWVQGSNPWGCTNQKSKLKKSSENQWFLELFFYEFLQNINLRVNVKTWGIHSLCINFRQSEQEESSVLYSSELCAELLYFCIERFGSSVCWTSVKEVDYFPVMHLYGTCHSSESKKPGSAEISGW